MLPERGLWPNSARGWVCRKAAWRRSSLLSPEWRSPPRLHRRADLALLIGKAFRELMASRAWWLLLLLIGPLAGYSFLTAAGLYAEASGIGGGPSALAQGLSPLDGILVPSFGAYDLA